MMVRYINDKEYDESYPQGRIYNRFREQLHKVPKGEYFVMGDNRAVVASPADYKEVGWIKAMQYDGQV